MKQHGFVLISLLMLSIILSMLAMAAATQSRLNSRFVANLYDNLLEQERAFTILRQAEWGIALHNAASSSRYSISQIGRRLNSWNYLDHGGAVIDRISINAYGLQAIWWQRLADQSQSITRFLARDGHIYTIAIIKKPLGIQLSNGRLSKVFTFPKSVTQLGLPLLMANEMSYASMLFIADDHHTIWQLDLTQKFADWQLKKAFRLNSPAVLTIPLWAAASANNTLELYVATEAGIEAWELDKKTKLLWYSPHLALNFFLEGKRLWWLARNGWNDLKLGAVNRFNGQTIKSPLFVKAPNQEIFLFTPKSRDYGWQLIPDNSKQIEKLYIAGKVILLYPPPYESGEQGLKTV